MDGETNGSQEAMWGEQDQAQQQGQVRRETQQGRSQVETPDYEKQVAEPDEKIAFLEARVAEPWLFEEPASMPRVAHRCILHGRNPIRRL